MISIFSSRECSFSASSDTHGSSFKVFRFQWQTGRKLFVMFIYLHSCIKNRVFMQVLFRLMNFCTLDLYNKKKVHVYIRFQTNTPFLFSHKAEFRYFLMIFCTLPIKIRVKLLHQLPWFIHSTPKQLK